MLVALGCTACARGHASPDGVGTLPPWLEYHRVASRLQIEGSVDQHVSPETQLTQSLAPLARVVVAVDDGIRNLVASIDTAGVIREPSAGLGTARVVPFTAPVVDYAPTASTWFATPRHAAIVQGGIEIIGDGSRWRFPNTEGFTSIAETCLARELPSTEPLPCFGRLPRPGEPMVLRQDSTIGPLSRVEWNALKTTSRQLLAGWELGGGPRTDAEVLQIAGAWGRSEDGWRKPYRPALVCGVLADHTVACWGTSQYYELGDGTRSTKRRYVHVPGLTDVVEVAVGQNFACARTSSGKVACWGDAAQGAFPLPKQQSGTAIPGCKVDTEATEREYRALVARAKAHADACMSSPCAPGTLDCHLGCGPHHHDKRLIYRRDGGCTTSRAFGRPQVLDLVDVISISAGHSVACFVFANGYMTCGGG